VQIIEFTGDNSRFADTLPAQSLADGFCSSLPTAKSRNAIRPWLQQAQSLGGSPRCWTCTA
jgi:hypothetical protein